jgi:hypothetical protein
MVRAQMWATRGDTASVGALGSMLDTAPPGFAGWTIPVEPFLQELQQRPEFASILTRLAERAR